MSGRNRAEILARVTVAKAALKSPEFAARLNTALDAQGKKGGTQAEVCAVALQVLGAMGVDLAGVAVAMTWDAAQRRLTVRHVRPAPRAPRDRRETPPELRAVE